MTRRLAREEGLLVGGSCGHGRGGRAARWRPRPAPTPSIVVLLPDGGRGYLSKIFNDDWMADYGFLDARTAEPTVADVLARKGAVLPELVHVHPDETVARGHRHPARVRRVADAGACKAEPPVMAAEVVGSVVERDLLDALLTGRARPGTTRSSEHMSPPLPLIGAGEPLSARGRPRSRRPTPRWCWSTASRRA